MGGPVGGHDEREQSVDDARARAAVHVVVARERPQRAKAFRDWSSRRQRVRGCGNGTAFERQRAGLREKLTGKEL
eukprot:6197704-Pleurochrysis_carterae.AAC.1